MNIRWSGVAAIAVVWTGIGAAVIRTGFPILGELPLSRLANDTRAGALFGSSLVVAALLFIIFCGYLSRRHPVGPSFSVLMVTAMTGQLVAGVVPIGPIGRSNTVHVVAALLLGGLIPVFLWRFAAGQPPGRWRLRCYGLFWAQLLASVVGVILSQRGVAPLAEIVPAFFFHLWVVKLSLHHLAGDRVAGNYPSVHEALSIRAA